MDDFEQVDGYAEERTGPGILGPILTTVLVGLITFLLYGLVFGGLGGGDDGLLAEDEASAPADAPAIESAEPGDVATLAPTEELGAEVAPTPISPAPTPPGQEGTEAPAAAGGQIGAGVSVQVVNGANTGAERFDAAVTALNELGYSVTEAGTSPNAYAQTTVFPSPDQEAQAQALVNGDPRFVVVGENPGNLREDIQIHVLVGEDFPTG